MPVGVPDRYYRNGRKLRGLTPGSFLRIIDKNHGLYGSMTQEADMENQDFFMEIAKTKHPSSTTDREVEPRTVPQVMLSKVTDGAQPLPVENKWEDFEARRADFEKDLKLLKEQYRPFMQSFLPDNPAPVEKKELKTFQFRYLDQKECFTRRWEEGKSWEAVEIPDYRGPAREKGKWSGYYACRFTLPEEWRKACGKRVVLCFQCVDYIAKVFVNGNFAGSHEGFFAPFSMDISKYLEEENELIVLCENDIPILGEGTYLDGDKIYAATGPGWDDPEVGWHHCPAGAGIFGRVTLELRPELFLEDVFVRGDIDKDTAEVRIGLHNYTDEVKLHYELSFTMDPRNYTGEAIGELHKEILSIGPGKNEYRFYVPVSGYRLWDPQQPWLYGLTAQLTCRGLLISSIQKNFGIKQFISDEAKNPKGKFYLNHKPIVLRGANEMGHLQQCVMKGDLEQLVEDILIAKLCNMNYYRVTQRPVQEEIYDYFDMLGMMHQCDFPLFSYLRRPQFAEALRQVVEMEHLIRNHVSTVMVTFINEPVCIRRTENPDDKFSRRYEAKGHRHLLRDELEAFFSAARKAVYTENPDRVIKNVEGDYDGPTLEGMPDFHCYTMWYTNHGEPIGRLMRGYLPPVKQGWMIGCGEYGAEGLDNEDIIRSRYPAAWLETQENGDWYPDKIVRSQTHSVQGDWYPEQHTIEDWVRESQLHQARATKLMTEALRRRGDLIQQTAIHLLIDAWPSGWMKTLLGCDRKPKRAYFAYQEALTPLKVNLYTPRSWVYEEETIPVEAWVLNDTSQECGLYVKAQIAENADLTKAVYFERRITVRAVSAECAGLIPVSFSQTGVSRSVTVTAALADNNGEVFHTETIKLHVEPRKAMEKQVYCLGEQAQRLGAVLCGRRIREIESADDQESMDFPKKDMPLPENSSNRLWIVSSSRAQDVEALYRHAEQGGSGILLMDAWKENEVPDTLPDGHSLKRKSCGELFFVDAAPEWREYGISMLYNERKGYIDATIEHTLETDLSGEEILFTYGKQGFLGSQGPKPHLPAVFCADVGSGKLLLSTLCLDGRVGCNSGLDRLLLDLAEKKL